MNAKQIANIACLTQHLQIYNRFDGPLIFRVEKMETSDRVILVASNSTDERKWYEKSLHFVATIGTRGAVRHVDTNMLFLWGKVRKN